MVLSSSDAGRYDALCLGAPRFLILKTVSQRSSINPALSANQISIQVVCHPKINKKRKTASRQLQKLLDGLLFSILSQDLLRRLVEGVSQSLNVFRSGKCLQKVSQNFSRTRHSAVTILVGGGEVTFPYLRIVAAVFAANGSGICHGVLPFCCSSSDVPEFVNPYFSCISSGAL